MKGPTVISFWKGLGIFSRDFFFLEFVQRFFCNFLLGIFLDFWFQFLILFLLGFLQEFPKNYFKNPSVDFSRNFIFILTGISSEITIRIPQGICPRTPVENLREITTGFFQEFMYGFVLLFILFLLGFLQKFPKNCFQESFREFSRNFILNSNRNFVTIYSPGFVMEFPLRFLQFFFGILPQIFWDSSRNSLRASFPIPTRGARLRQYPIFLCILRQILHQGFFPGILQRFL